MTDWIGLMYFIWIILTVLSCYFSFLLGRQHSRKKEEEAEMPINLENIIIPDIDPTSTCVKPPPLRMRREGSLERPEETERIKELKKIQELRDEQIKMDWNKGNE